MLRSLSLLALFAACGGDDGPFDPDDHAPGDLDPVIGATCFDSRDCYARCASGGDFPGGFCTLPCRDDIDCTSDTVCADVQDGICLFPCAGHSECEFLGPAYFCRERNDLYDRRIFVCMSD